MVQVNCHHNRPNTAVSIPEDERRTITLSTKLTNKKPTGKVGWSKKPPGGSI